MTLSNQTVATLRTMAKEEGLKNYSKLNKAELVALLEQYYRDTMARETEAYYVLDGTYSETVEGLEEPVAVERVLDTKGVSEFVNRYKGFTLYEHLRSYAPYARQINLAKAIMNNFETEIAITTIHTAGEMSDILADKLIAIENGTLKARPIEVVKDMVKAYKPEPEVKKVQLDKCASKAQIAYINRLEKETGVTNTTILNSVKTANEVIQKYLAIKKANVTSEVAVTTVENKFNDVNFKTKFIAMMKRVFA